MVADADSGFRGQLRFGLTGSAPHGPGPNCQRREKSVRAAGLALARPASFGTWLSIRPALLCCTCPSQLLRCLRPRSSAARPSEAGTPRYGPLMEEIAPGLWRWTAPHPEWALGAERDSPDDWDEYVGSVFYEDRDTAVFIDPLLPGDQDQFWRWAERARCGTQPGGTDNARPASAKP